MYVKALMPGDKPIPMVIIANSDFDALHGNLLDMGWGHADLTQEKSVAQLRISPQRLHIEHEGELILEDSSNPKAPDGWYTAIDDFGNRCLAVVVPEGSVDLSAPNLLESLMNLFQQNRVITGALDLRISAFS